MSAPVDVLAVLDEAACALSNAEYIGHAQELKEVRVVLAELIKADRQYDDMKQAKFDAVAVGGIVQQRDADRAFQAARKRRAAALAAVGPK